MTDPGITDAWGSSVERGVFEAGLLGAPLAGVGRLGVVLPVAPKRQLPPRPSSSPCHWYLALVAFQNPSRC